jgi:hypothetical protein
MRTTLIALCLTAAGCASGGIQCTSTEPRFAAIASFRERQWVEVQPAEVLRAWPQRLHRDSGSSVTDSARHTIPSATYLRLERHSTERCECCDYIEFVEDDGALHLSAIALHFHAGSLAQAVTLAKQGLLSGIPTNHTPELEGEGWSVPPRHTWSKTYPWQEPLVPGTLALRVGISEVGLDPDGHGSWHVFIRHSRQVISPK